ncbi:hypothetical protein, partial [Agarivorans sp. B2Z047]
DYCARTLWQKWEQAGEKAQHKAEHDLRVVRCWHVLKRAGLKKDQATDTVSQKNIAYQPKLSAAYLLK